MKKSSVLVGVMVLCLFGIARGDVIHIPGDYPTIQEGLGTASTGDTVLVAPGTYTENMFWPPVNGIKLFSELGPDTTVIDGGSAGRVIYFSGTATIDTTTVIRGFTIQNGGGVDCGGGVCLIRSSPRIENNIVEGNSAYDGGGICCSDNSSPIIIENTFQGNSASLSDGGAIYCYDGSNPTITNNTITDNSAGWWGGGIFCRSSGATITGNTISSNWASRGSGIFCYVSPATITGNTISSNSANHGSGIYCYRYSNPTITNNTITDNSAYFDGGGISCHDGSNPTITHNQITGNSAGDDGGGIACSDDSNPTITGNTISNNSASDDGGGISCYDHANPTITNNRITDNSAGWCGGGIHCQYASSPLIRCNVIAENSANSLGDGIYCKHGSFPTVDSNGIYNNGFGVYNADSSETLKAEYNWWGDASGPYHPAFNPFGLGDSTNMFVDPVPWLTDPVGVEEEVTREQPSANRLQQNYPNPFSQRTYIGYQLPGNMDASLVIYNSAGRVARIFLLTTGNSTVCWDGRDGNGFELANGIYFYRLAVGKYRVTKKMILLR